MKLTNEEKDLLHRGKSFAEDYQSYCKERPCNDECVFMRYGFCLDDIQVVDFLDFDWMLSNNYKRRGELII